MGFCFFRRCFCLDAALVLVVACKVESEDVRVVFVVWKLAAIRLEEKEGTKPFVVQNVKELPKKKRRLQTEDDKQVRVGRLELAPQSIRDVMTDWH